MCPSDPTTGLAVITPSGIVVTDPRLHCTVHGPVTRFDVVAHERHFDSVTGQWADTRDDFAALFHRAQAARKVAASLTRGTRVLITGVLRQREWEDTAGNKRYAYESTPPKSLRHSISPR